jgi:hypothetical protein
MSHFDRSDDDDGQEEPAVILRALYEERRRIEYRRNWNKLFAAFGNEQIDKKKNIRMAAALGDVDRRIEEYLEELKNG